MASYRKDHETLLPHLKTVLSYLPPLQLEKLLDQPCLTQLVEACLSTSYLRDKDWKFTAISAAAQAAKALALAGSSYGAVLTAKVQIRDLTPLRLYEEPSQNDRRHHVPYN